MRFMCAYGKGQVDPVVQRESLERDRALQYRGELTLPPEVKTDSACQRGGAGKRRALAHTKW